IFYNLVDNALKYAGKNPKVHVAFTTKNKNHFIVISDNGPGIDHAHLNHIFDKFYRIPRPDNKEIEGFGIGLYYVKKIIRLHNWKINVQNNPKGGLDVLIQIPI
ncbi:ATP-binding protein, partial [Arthrospira platensis SPKY1]|nr:ATP-binding protein [Arthrospira platensis SPKY1]